MRMLMKVQIPVEAGNAAIKDGTLGKIVRQAMESLKPEAAYFTAMDGKRTMLAFFDLRAESDIPSAAEPFFTGMNASVEFVPCMNAADLKTGLEKLG